MSALISVVIPVYNVDNYLKECLDSVINQTYSNLQIILVDDGSTDRSGDICEEYAAKDSRIMVVHQVNMGAGAAKNVGLDMAIGDFVSLIDSDDYLTLDYYEVMMSYFDKFNVDIVQCLFKSDYVFNSYPRNYCFPAKGNRIIKSERFLLEMLYDWRYAIFWNKLFKTSLLKKEIRFPVGRKIDDEFFTYKLICNAKKILNINDILYHYRVRSTSVMNENTQKQLITDRIDCFCERYKFISSRYPRLAKFYNNHLCSYLAQKRVELQDCKKITENLEYFTYIELSPIEKLFTILLEMNLKDDVEIDIASEEMFG